MPSANRPTGTGHLVAEIALLERLELAEIGEMLAGLDEHLGLEAVALARLGGVGQGLPCRPRAWRDSPSRNGSATSSPPPPVIGVMPASFSFFTAARKSSQVLIEAASTPACSEQLLVVVEADEAGLVGDRPDLVVDRQAGDERRAVDCLELAAVGIHRLGDVLDGAGLRLGRQHAAAPGVEHMRRIVRLQQRRQLGLERLVLEELHLDLHAGMSRLIGLDDLVPGGADAGIGVEMQPFHGDVGESGRGRDGERGGRADQRLELHAKTSHGRTGLLSRAAA